MFCCSVSEDKRERESRVCLSRSALMVVGVVLVYTNKKIDRSLLPRRRRRTHFGHGCLPMRNASKCSLSDSAVRRQRQRVLLSLFLALFFVSSLLLFQSNYFNDGYTAKSNLPNCINKLFNHVATEMCNCACIHVRYLDLIRR